MGYWWRYGGTYNQLMDFFLALVRSQNGVAVMGKALFLSPLSLFVLQSWYIICIICIICILYFMIFHYHLLLLSWVSSYTQFNRHRCVVYIYISKYLGASLWATYSTYQAKKSIDQSIYLSICVPTCTSLSTCPSTCPPTCLCRCLDTCRSICLCQASQSIWPFYLSICLSIWTLPVAGNSYVVVCPSPPSNVDPMQNHFPLYFIDPSRTWTFEITQIVVPFRHHVWAL